MKYCKRCETDKDESEFSKSRCTKDGLQVWCKSCMSFYGATDENKKKINETRKKKRRAGYYAAVEKPKRLEHRLKNIELYIWRACKERCRKYNIPFNIGIEDITIPEICPLLEIPIASSISRATENSPSLDRIIPKLGYIKGNVRVISLKANWMKSNASKEDFEIFYKNIFNYLK